MLVCVVSRDSAGLSRWLDWNACEHRRCDLCLCAEANCSSCSKLSLISCSDLGGTPSGFFPPPVAIQVIGTALALLLLSGGAMPLWAGVVVAAASAYLMLFLERLGVRYLEVLFELLIAGALRIVISRLLTRLHGRRQDRRLHGTLWFMLTCSAKPCCCAAHELVLHCRCRIVRKPQPCSFHATPP